MKLARVTSIGVTSLVAGHAGEARAEEEIDGKIGHSYSLLEGMAQKS